MPPKYKKYTKGSQGNSKKYQSTDVFVKSSQNWLVIVESPSKCSKIESYLGDQYKCIASVGHLRELGGLKTIDSKNNFTPRFSIIEKKSNHIDTMKKIILQFPQDHVLLATDDDREGEAIAWHICEIFELDVSRTPRIVFHEVTKPALLAAVASPGRINMNLVRAQWARQVLDILIGYKVSPVLWKYMYNDKDNSLSAGRCQTPALRLIYDNDQERIRSGEGEQKHKITGIFTSKNISFVLSTEMDSGELVLPFLEKSRGFSHQLSLGTTRNSIQSSPKPFNTSTLLQIANTTLHISPKETMSLCQILYQNGHITYMRTESRKYSAPFLKDVRQYIQGRWDDSYVGDLNKIENQDGKNPHEAIRVTHLLVNELDGKEYSGKIVSLYKLIWRTTIQSCMSDSKLNLTDALLTAPDKMNYKYTVEVPIFLGWKRLAGGTDSVVDSQNTGSGLLLYFESLISSKHPIQHQKIYSTVVFHHKHSHYTESGLIKQLEDFGIGRPSTFAMFIETIQDRGYVKKMNIEGKIVICPEYELVEGKIVHHSREKTVGNEKDKLVLQPLGKIIIDFLIQNFDHAFSYDYTKQLEEKLDSISTMEKDASEEWFFPCKECDEDLKKAIQPLSAVAKKTYTLGNDEDGGTYSVAFTKFGPNIQKTLPGSQEISYLPVKKQIQIIIGRLERGEYTLEELMDVPTRCLGKWENQDIYLKNGRYGHYLEWGNNKKTCNQYKTPMDEITLEDVPHILQQNLEKSNNPNILRVLNEHMSVRKGKFGAYIYYKTPEMAKPSFLNMKKFGYGFSTCEREILIEWIDKTYFSK